MIASLVVLTIFLFEQGDFPICQAGDVQATPEIIFADSLFYVFWTDFRYSSIDTYSVYGSRVTASGIALDPDGKKIFANKAETRSAVAYDGANFLVVLQDSC
ncbi:MAG: hypothetical protein JSV53_06875 [candidate division WOR-3 bacterium]|nr:MAG: hypothetical protein JSV53_06875 [candidate division WOR-3 bacterium]